jgi:hypothetical protein
MGSSFWQQYAFYRSGHFVAGDLAVDAFDGSFFTVRHAAPQSQNPTPERQDARNVTTQSIGRNSLGFLTLLVISCLPDQRLRPYPLARICARQIEALELLARPQPA